jgi:hypothetical protein
MRKAHDFVLSDKAGRGSRQFLPWPFLVAPTQVNANGLLREVQAAEEGVEVGGRADSCSTMCTESSHEYAEALTVP